MGSATDHRGPEAETLRGRKVVRWQFSYPKRLSFYPPDLEEPGLGGCEAALVLLARELVRRGHAVEVFNCCFRPGVYDGVRWRMLWELESADTPDVAVMVRFEEAIWPQAADSPNVLFWMLDDRADGPAAFADTFGKRGRIVVASKAMEMRLRSAGRQEVVTCIPLPVDLDLYGSRKDRALACLFASMPNRGADIALEIWPRVRKQVPTAELWITGGWQLWGYTRSEARDRWNQLLQGRQIPEGVRLFGALPRGQLRDLQEVAWLGLYPSRFPEMFCLVAAEAAAAGLPMIASASDALLERIDHGHTGYLVYGDIEHDDVQDAFVARTVDLLQSPSLRQTLAANAISSAQQYGLGAVAQRWEALVC